MEAMLLSILLLAGPSTDMGQSAQSGARVQAVARARIISGQSIAFEHGLSRTASVHSTEKGRTLHLPLARSENKRPEKEQPILSMLEFF